jgi:hypothetical protein
LKCWWHIFGARMFRRPSVISASVRVETGPINSAVSRRSDRWFGDFVRSVGCCVFIVDVGAATLLRRIVIAIRIYGNCVTSQVFPRGNCGCSDVLFLSRATARSDTCRARSDINTLDDHSSTLAIPAPGEFQILTPPHILGRICGKF